MSTSEIDPEWKKIALGVTVIINIIFISILIASYDRMYQDDRMYEYYPCTIRPPHEIIEPEYHDTGNSTAKATCYKLKLDPKIHGIGHRSEPVIGLYPVIIVFGLVSLFLVYDLFYLRRQ